MSGGVQDGIASQTRSLHVLRRAIGLAHRPGLTTSWQTSTVTRRAVSAEAW